MGLSTLWARVQNTAMPQVLWQVPQSAWLASAVAAGASQGTCACGQWCTAVGLPFPGPSADVEAHPGCRSSRAQIRAANHGRIQGL